MRLIALMPSERIDASRSTCVMRSMPGNRGAKFDAGLLREEDRRASGTDALRKIQQSEYLKNAGGYTPKSGLPSYGFGPKAPTDTERIAAEELGKEARRRLDAGDSLIDPSLMNEGAREKTAGLIGLGATAASAIPGSTWRKLAALIGKAF